MFSSQVVLVSENKEIARSLFTTLSTTTRSFAINNNNTNLNDNDNKEEKGMSLFLIDTVGFISRLPHYMIHAFKSTLEESLAADLILLLIDASEKREDIRIKYNSCWNVLNELKVDKSRVFTILTKCDNGVIDPFDLIENIGNDLGVIDPIALSAKIGYGIYKLKIAQKLHTQYLPGMQPSTKVNTDATIITSNIHT